MTEDEIQKEVEGLVRALGLAGKPPQRATITAALRRAAGIKDPVEEALSAGFPAYGILSSELALRGVDTFGLYVGRPTTVRLRACKHNIGLRVGDYTNDSWLMVNGEPTTAVVSFASARARGQASFTIGGLTEEVTSESPTVFLLVLLSEARVWCVPHAYARRVHKGLRDGMPSARFACGASTGSIRVLLPKKQTLYDLDLALRQSP